MKQLKHFATLTAYARLSTLVARKSPGDGLQLANRDWNVGIWRNDDMVNALRFP